MCKLFNKNHLLTLMWILLFNIVGSSVVAGHCCYSCPHNKMYIGVFGGENYSNRTKLIQTGTAFFTEAEGGPLAVDARGHSRRNHSWFAGGQIGYEWAECPRYLGCSNWYITPAAEIEAYFYRHTKKGHLINDTLLRLDEHDFINSFPMDVGVYLVNGVASLNNSCMGKFSPYIGGGIGAANIYVRHAKSLQISPPEPGINHFNSRRHDSTWAFAAQAKAGVRFNICERFHIFAEYRFLFVDSSNYIFGSTAYPNHAPTSTWNVQVKNMIYNSYAVGIRFDL